MIVVSKYPSIKEADWTELKQAGCIYWKHNESGTISNECPFKDEESPVHTVNIDPKKEGTGALVYDSQEFENFIRDLDQLASESNSPLRKV